MHTDTTVRPDRSDMSLLSVAPAAAPLGVNERSVRRYIARGALAAERVPTVRHTHEIRISPAALADFSGRRDALAHEAPLPRTALPDQWDRPDTPAVRAADVQARVASISDRLADKDALVAELRRRAETAERAAAALRQERRLPWWRRLCVRG